MKWFKHDAAANMDAKLRRVRLKYGMEGYGLYWYCLELIAGSVEKNNLTFELEHDAEIIAYDVGISQALVEEMMVFMCEQGLFENDTGKITCLKMLTRSDEYTQKIIRGDITCRDSVPTLSGENPKKSLLLEQNRTEQNRKEGGPHPDPHTDPDQAKPRSRFAPPTLEEVRKYVREKGYSIDPEQFFDYYTANGWFQGKAKIKDWKACVRTWVNRDQAFLAAKPKKDPFAGAL